MTLNLGALNVQISAMAHHARTHVTGEHERAEHALAMLRQLAGRWEDLAADAEARRHCPPVALPLEAPDRRYPAPPPLTDYVVLATDGSQIEPDRHAPVYCHLINVGRVRLRYGRLPSAVLDSCPYLAYREDDLYLRAGNRQVPIEGHLLAMKRHVIETQEVATLTEESDTLFADSDDRRSVPRPDFPIVALQDGTLTLPVVEGRIVEEMLQRKLLDVFLAALEKLRSLRIPIAAYVSLPRASEVVNLLRVAECPFRPDECDRRCNDIYLPTTVGCQQLAGLPDRTVFERLLVGPGERSCYFRSPWTTSLQYYGQHRAHFFYLNVGAEIARVEVPEWVAEDSELTNLVHAAILDQVDRGQGYPRALVEAHEQAVVRILDRRVFWELVARQLTGQRIYAPGSVKQQSKRYRSL